MKKFLKICVLIMVAGHINGQTVEIHGALKLGNSVNVPDPGTMRWTGSDFQGWTGEKWISFTISGQVYDADGNEYNPVKIGEQIWLGQNLKTTKYNDGSPIPVAHVLEDWTFATDNKLPSVTWYWNDSLTYFKEYGGLYNFYAVDTSSNGNKNVCPSGYHVPTRTEMDTLVSHLGGSLIAGGVVKNVENSYWDAPNTGANNKSGFSSPGAGRRGPSGTFAGIKMGTYLRTSTPHATSSSNAYYGLLLFNNQEMNVISWNRGIGMSVRCIKD